MLSRLLASLLFNVTAHDPITYAGVVVLLIATALVACVVPARKALAIDLVSALRTESIVVRIP